MAKTKITKTFLIKEYLGNKRSTRNIAKEIKCNNTTIFYYLKRYGIKIRTKGEAQTGKFGSKSRGWKGGKFKTLMDIFISIILSIQMQMEVDTF